MSDSSIKQRTRSKRPPKAWLQRHRPKVYKAPPPTGFRRVLAAVFNAWTLSIAGVLIVAAFLTLTYYWMDFSDRIDRKLLSGEVFTPTAGIYSAPKTLRKGEKISRDELLAYLRSAGYIERNDKADRSRSRYSLDGDNLGIEPGVSAMIDGKKAFPSLTVKFSKDGKSVDAIGDRDSETQVKDARLEPKMLSTIAGEGDGRRRSVNFNDIPPLLVKAITVTEDRSFFDHYGVNFRGIARAAWRRYEGDDDGPLSNQGGSSITQQLVKNLLLTNEKTLSRKITEAYMSVIVETRLTKQEIFTLYANQIYLGQQSGVSIYGVGEAADAYFGKDVAQLSLPEAAFIAGTIRSPNRYSPYKHPEKARERRNQVLESMVEAGEIAPQDAEAAKAVPLELKQIDKKRDLQGMPYFSQFAIEELPKLVSDPEALQHLRVYTSIDPDLQKMAYETVAKRLAALDKQFPKKKDDLNAALVSIRPKTGEIVAMVGGRDYLKNQFNRATDAKRQPGSVFKPFVYGTAINSAYDSGSRVFTAATVIKDEKKVFTFDQNSYSPNNFGDSFSGQELTLRDALVKSKNVITVDLAMQLNIGKVMNFAAKAGFPKVDKAYPSMALGTAEATPLEVATAYTMYANLGDRVLPTPITQITSGDGTTETLVTPDRKSVIRPDVAYIMDDMMKDVINRGTAASAKAWGFQNVAGKTAFAGKTGTSRDGWFAGFTPDLVTVVYVGFDSGGDLGITGADSALPIWADFMKAALALHPEWNGDWAMPAGVRRAEIDIRYGSLIRPLDDLTAVDPAAPTSPTPTPMPPSPGVDPTLFDDDLEPKTEPEIYVTNVPKEFVRTELFIAGTLPNRRLISTADALNYGDGPLPLPSQTPIEETWAESEASAADKEKRENNEKQPEKFVTVMVCTASGKRATPNCPDRELRSFSKGTEPKELCPIHIEK